MPAKKMEISKTVNPDLANERIKCTFDREEFARYWLDGEQKLQEKRARGNRLKYFMTIITCLCLMCMRLHVCVVRAAALNSIRTETFDYKKVKAQNLEVDDNE